MQGLVVIKKCDMNSKVGQKTIKKWQVLQSVAIITKWDSFKRSGQSIKKEK